MFKSDGKIFSLLIGNHLDSCKEDVKKMQNILKKYNSDIKTCLDCNPKKELLSYLKYRNMQKNDIFILHFSGHGERIGRKIKNKVELVSTWLNIDKTYTYSFEICDILSRLNCKIFLFSDSCHSGNFSNFYNGNNPFIFIGSSKFVNKSDDYKFDNKYSGALVNLFEYFITKTDIYNLNINKLKELTYEFYKINKIKIKPVIIYKNF